MPRTPLAKLEYRRRRRALPGSIPEHRLAGSAPSPHFHGSYPRAVTPRAVAAPAPALTELAVAVAAPAQSLQVALQHVGEEVAGRDLHRVPAQRLADLSHRHPQQTPRVALAHPGRLSAAWARSPPWPGEGGEAHAQAMEPAAANAAILGSRRVPAGRDQTAPLHRRAHRWGGRSIDCSGLQRGLPGLALEERGAGGKRQNYREGDWGGQQWGGGRDGERGEEKWGQVKGLETWGEGN
uniref:Uncharacterized protein n=1 Tax=Chrysemys picta bellii TaxID=8478 RepID=A0A8C3I4J7_CHRPI